MPKRNRVGTSNSVEERRRSINGWGSRKGQQVNDENQVLLPGLLSRWRRPPRSWRPVPGCACWAVPHPHAHVCSSCLPYHCSTFAKERSFFQHRVIDHQEGRFLITRIVLRGFLLLLRVKGADEGIWSLSTGLLSSSDSRMTVAGSSPCWRRTSSQ
jgi:hypothetical protein